MAAATEVAMTPVAMGVVLTGATTRAVDTTAGGLLGVLRCRVAVGVLGLLRGVGFWSLRQ